MCYTEGMFASETSVFGSRKLGSRTVHCIHFNDEHREVHAVKSRDRVETAQFQTQLLRLSVFKLQ